MRGATALTDDSAHVAVADALVVLRRGRRARAVLPAAATASKPYEKPRGEIFTFGA